VIKIICALTFPQDHFDIKYPKPYPATLMVKEYIFAEMLPLKNEPHLIAFLWSQDQLLWFMQRCTFSPSNGKNSSSFSHP